MQSADSDQAAEIWLEANLQAHDFIDPCYWNSHLDEVKTQLAQAEGFVCQRETGLAGFIGLQNGFIAGLFVRDSFRGQGVGKALLNRAKEACERLSLDVYQKNRRAVAFYLREGFQIWRESRDIHTGEDEYRMEWNSLSDSERAKGKQNL